MVAIVAPVKREKGPKQRFQGWFYTSDGVGVVIRRVELYCLLALFLLQVSLGFVLKNQLDVLSVKDAFHTQTS